MRRSRPSAPVQRADIIQPGRMRRQDEAPPHDPLCWSEDEWTRHLADAVVGIGALCERLELDPQLLDVDPSPTFALRVPHPFVDRMRRGDPRDPLLLQVLARLVEREATEGYEADPLRETEASPAPGIIRKYPGRALLIAASACAVHCRYCFRRHFPYEQHRDPDVRFDALEADPSLTEVILSGGDPLMLKDAPLLRLVRRLERIAHLRRIRIHTRLPVVIPQRVTQGLLRMLSSCHLPTTVVLHVNHPNEMDDAFAHAMDRLSATGVTLLNQSVLLAGVNDSADTLCELSERLHDHHVLPYYLHLLDPVQGARHFAVPESRARALWREAADRLPGYLMPRLAREVPGARAKELIEGGLEGNLVL